MQYILTEEEYLDLKRVRTVYPDELENYELSQVLRKIPCVGNNTYRNIVEAFSQQDLIVCRKR